VPHISVVAPVYREEANVAEFCRRVSNAVSSIAPDFEIILVEDGGGDGSWQKICEQSSADPRIKGLKFSRNFGQHYAITAGLDVADGDWTIVMDSDLQDRPEVIPDLYAKAQQGYEVVFVARQDRPETRRYRLLQRIFYAGLRHLAASDYDPEHGNFSIISRKVLKDFRSLKEQLRFYGGIIFWLGYPHASIPAAHGRRYAGHSVYTLKSRLRLAASIIIAHSDRPLRFSVALGFVMAFLSFLYGIYIIIRALLGTIVIEGWASLIVSIYFVGGLIMMVLGIIGIYIGKMYNETKHRPLYIVADSVGFRRVPESLGGLVADNVRAGKAVSDGAMASAK
jgi:dolichol-phosphate mannosyltransferase